jgi:hypothetical protein
MDREIWNNISLHILLISNEQSRVKSCKKIFDIRDKVIYIADLSVGKNDKSHNESFAFLNEIIVDLIILIEILLMSSIYRLYIR